MKKPTIEKILNQYRNYLTETEIAELQKIQKTPSDFATQARAIHRTLFSEETDFQSDSISDAHGRSRGENPMSRDYIDRIDRKRRAFGVSPLNEAGNSIDRSSEDFCEEVVRFSKNYRELIALKKRKAQQVVFVDMDNVLVDFQSGIDQISEAERTQYAGDLDEVPGIFSLMKPYEGAIEAFHWLSKNFDTYILSAASWDNPSAWQDKLLWVKKYLPEVAYKRLILSHNKHLAKGDFLIDDRTKNGAGKFSGKHIHFGPNGDRDFPDWKAVVDYLKDLV